MTPQTVNAYYNPTTNEICFPAGILQPPFFDMEADDAYNYGAIGVVIGHEMTHGFDDQGRQFDKNGNLTDWWAPGDAERFEARAKVMEDFFSNIEVLPGLKGTVLDFGREPGRSRWFDGFIYGIPKCNEREAFADGRRLYARTALLPGLCKSVGRKYP